MSNKEDALTEARLPDVEWYYPESPRTISRPDEVKEGIARALRATWDRIPVSARTLMAPRITRIELVSGKLVMSGYENGVLLIGACEYVPDGAHDDVMVFTLAQLLACCFVDSLFAAAAGGPMDSAMAALREDHQMNETLAEALMAAWGFGPEYAAHAGKYDEKDWLKILPLLARRLESRRKMLEAGA